jgi:hypothetical protein
MNYGLAYRIGFHPWEDAEEQPSFTDKFSTLLDREPTALRSGARRGGVQFRGAKAPRVAREARGALVPTPSQVTWTRARRCQ